MTASQYLRTFARFWWLVLVCTGVGVVAGLIYSSAEPTTYRVSGYATMATTKAVPQDPSSLAAANSLAIQRMASYVAAASGTGLAEQIPEEDRSGASLTELADRLSVTIASGATVFRVTATADSESDARELADVGVKALIRLVATVEDTSTPGQRQLRARVLGSAQDQPVDTIAASPSRAPLLCGGAGLLVGLGLAVVLARAFPRLRDRRAVAELAGAPVLGALPRRQPGSAQYEQALAETRTGVLFLRDPGASGLLVALTTPRPDDMLKDLARDLATDLTATGAKVLLVDADLPRTGDHHQPGLADYLTASSPLRGLVRSDSRGFDVMAAGRAVGSPSDLLHHERFAALMSSATERYDQVLVLTPPTSAGTGAPAVAGRCGATVVVVGERSRAKDLRECLRVLSSGAARVRGVILTRGSRSSRGSRAAV